MKVKIISQKMLSAECWLVQVWGTTACKECDYKSSMSCGGSTIIKKGKNVLGYDIPLLDICANPITRRKDEG